MTHAQPKQSQIRRRAFLGGTAMAVLAAAQASGGRAWANQGTAAAPAAAPLGDTFEFEITRTEAEWRAMLTPQEYRILREGDTELPRTSPNWNRDEEGTYACRGCGLPVYDSIWKVQLDKGWAFFSQSRENAVLMGIDGNPPAGMPDENAPPAMIEVHCRRCGSHFGHILTVDKATLHCVDGTSLCFYPAAA